jgi:hypothetical protein
MQKRPIGGPKHRGEDNIKTELRKVELECTAFMWLRIGSKGELL